MRNSLIALMEALCDRIFSFRFVNIGFVNDACGTPQRPLRHELAWIWKHFLSEQRWATGLVETAEGVARAGGKRQPVRYKFAITSMTKKLLHCYIGAHARVHMHFCVEYACIHRCCAHRACAGVYI